ncbi:tape measure protein [Microbacterium phage Mercedes]|nr:tape measure protein [Microbacterium phage Mercedes]
MADNDVKIKVSMDGDKVVIGGLTGIGTAAGEADSKTSKFGSGLKGVGTALVGFAGAAAAAGGALVGAVTNSYASAEQSVGGIETLFKGSADRMKTYAADAYKTAGLSANEYMEQATSMSASLIQSVGGDTAKAAELANTALISMSDNANKMGTDLTSIQNAFGGFAKGNFTMLDNLKLGYGGTQEEMARLLADAEKLPSAMGQKFDMSNYGDVVTAIQLIQEEMGIAGTTALEANSTISGSVAGLKGAFDNLLVSMGSANNESLAFLDVQEQAANVVSQLEIVIGNITPVIESIGSSMGTLGPQLGTMMGTLVEAVAAAIPAILDAGVALVGGLLTGISTALPTLITALVPGVIGLVNTLSGLLPLLVAAGAEAVVALVTGLATAAPQIIPALTEAVLGMVQELINAAPALIEAGLQLMDGLFQGIMQALPIIIESLPYLIEGIVTFITTSIPMILEAGVQLFMGLVQALPEVITQIVAVLPGMITSIIEAIVSLIPMIVQAGVQLLTALVQNLPIIIQTIVTAIPQIISSVLTAVLGAIPQIIQGGIQLFIALIGALPQIITTIVAAIPQIITGVIGAVVGAIPQIISAGVQLLIALVQNMPAILSGIVQAIPQIITGIVDAIVKAVPELADAGLQLIKGLWNGISDAAGWLMDKIGGFVDDVVGNIKDFFGIASPSRRLKFEVGVQLPAGVGAGVEQNEEAALRPIRDLNAKMMDEAAAFNGTIAFTHDATLTQTMVPMAATPQMPANVSIEATLDPSLVGAAVAEAFSSNEQGREQAAVTLDRSSISTLAGAIVDAMRVQSRQGGVTGGF